MFGETIEVVQQEQNASGARSMRIQHVATEQQKVGILGNRGVEDGFGRLIGGFDEGVAQVFGNFSDAIEAAKLSAEAQADD